MSTEKQTFDFYLDQKVTTWYRTKFEIEADSEEEARQKAIEFYKSGDCGYLDWDQVDDTIETMGVGENDGQATEELYDEASSEMICDNVS